MPKSNELAYKSYYVSVEEVPGQECVTIEAMYGCTGMAHAIWTDRVEHDESGEVVYAELVSIKDNGPCDGSCQFGFKTYKGGGFLYAPPLNVSA